MVRNSDSFHKEARGLALKELRGIFSKRPETADKDYAAYHEKRDVLKDRYLTENTRKLKYLPPFMMGMTAAAAITVYVALKPIVTNFIAGKGQATSALNQRPSISRPVSYRAQEVQTGQSVQAISI